MSLTLKLSVHPKFIHVTVTGEFSLNEAKRIFLEALDTIAGHKIEKVIMDGQQLSGELNTTERFYFAEFMSQSVQTFVQSIAWAPQFAFVLKTPMLDQNKFGETVAVNRGMNLRVFDNMEEAFEWLGETPVAPTEVID
ncbi:MAG TPA: hypothetical protein PLK30_24445 [Blastocatellia bacterium]|nr:hypothetical protein [Blastocatellia bacterium]